MSTYGILSSSTITGMNVKNHQNDNLGDIKDLMINTSNGEVEHAVLSFGGFLGMGDKYYAVPFNSFTVDRENEQFLLNVDKEFLENSHSSFNKGLFMTFGLILQ